MEALRDLADDFNVRDPRKLYRLARQRDLDVTQAMAFEALKADVGRQAQAPRPRALGKSAAEGPNDRLQADLIDFSQNTRGKTKYGLVVMDVFTREAGGTSAEQERRDGGPRHQARRKGADGGRRELRGHDRPGQRVRHAGPGAAGSRAPHEAARGPQRHCRGGPGHPDAEEGPGHERSDHFERAAGACNARPHETVHGAPEDVERQPATEFRVLQDNADKFQHNKDLAREGGGGRGRLPSADERGEELQPSVRRRAAAGGRGLHDRPQHGGPGDPARAAATRRARLGGDTPAFFLVFWAVSLNLENGVTKRQKWRSVTPPPQEIIFKLVEGPGPRRPQEVVQLPRSRRPTLSRQPTPAP